MYQATLITIDIRVSDIVMEWVSIKKEIVRFYYQLYGYVGTFVFKKRKQQQQQINYVNGGMLHEVYYVFT